MKNPLFKCLYFLHILFAIIIKPIESNLVSNKRYQFKFQEISLSLKEWVLNTKLKYDSLFAGPYQNFPFFCSLPDTIQLDSSLKSPGFFLSEFQALSSYIFLLLVSKFHVTGAWLDSFYAAYKLNQTVISETVTYRE